MLLRYVSRVEQTIAGVSRTWANVYSPGQVEHDDFAHALGLRSACVHLPVLQRQQLLINSGFQRGGGIRK